MKPNLDQTLNDPLVLRPDARKFFGGVSDATLANWVKDGVLPEPIRITERTVGWRLSTLQEVLGQAAQKGQP